jgi:uncharacterized spore protein YtfJ
MNERSPLDPKPRTAEALGASTPLNTIQTTMDTFFRAANVEAVYAPPIREGEHIVIPAAEVLSIAGFGLGAGSGSQGAAEQETPGSGGGGGGGGRVLSRPVAAVVISPTGVRVEPILDLTKIALAALTTLGFMAATLTRMQGKKPPELE